MHFVYVLYSHSIDRFYIGETHDVQLRLHKHNMDFYDNKWSARGKPWDLFFTIQCHDKSQAKQVEAHIKRMKSKTYIRNLKLYPQITERLLAKYSPSDQDC